MLRTQHTTKQTQDPQGGYPLEHLASPVEHTGKTCTRLGTFGCKARQMGIMAVQGVFSAVFAGVVTLILRLFAWHFFKS